MDEYNGNNCGICRMFFNRFSSEWITINIEVVDKVYVPICICEDHARKLLNKAGQIAQTEFLKSNNWYGQ